MATLEKLSDYNNSLKTYCKSNEVYDVIDPIEFDMDKLLGFECMVNAYPLYGENVENIDHKNKIIVEESSANISMMDKKLNISMMMRKLQKLRYLYPYFIFPIIYQRLYYDTNPSDKYMYTNKDLMLNPNIISSLFLQFLICHNIPNFSFSADLNIIKLPEPMSMGYKIGGQYVYIKSKYILSWDVPKEFSFTTDEGEYIYLGLYEDVTEYDMFFSNLKRFLIALGFTQENIPNVWSLLNKELQAIFDDKPSYDEDVGFLRDLWNRGGYNQLVEIFDQNNSFKEMIHSSLLRYIKLSPNMNSGTTENDIINSKQFDPVSDRSREFFSL